MFRNTSKSTNSLIASKKYRKFFDWYICLQMYKQTTNVKENHDIINVKAKKIVLLYFFH